MIIIFLSCLISWYLSIDTYVRHHHKTTDSQSSYTYIYRALDLDEIVVYPLSSSAKWLLQNLISPVNDFDEIDVEYSPIVEHFFDASFYL
jgi:hypothetical protein